MNGAANSNQDFTQQGFAVLPGFLSEPALDPARRAVQRTIAAEASNALQRDHNALYPLRWTNELLGLCATQEHIATIARQVGASDPRWISGYVTVKEPHAPALFWHQDWWAWSHEVSFKAVAPQVAILLYLTDTDERNGALRVLPGSHLRTTDAHRGLPEAHSSDSNELPGDHVAMRHILGERTLRMRAGDAVVFDYRLLHATHANNTSVRRDVIHLSFAPNWRALPEDIRGHLIDHPALPGLTEDGAELSWLLPTYAGPRRTLQVQRTPPEQFVAAA